MLDEWRPDVPVSDIGMPGEDGYELIRKAPACEPEREGRIPAADGVRLAEDAGRAIKAGYQAHVPKPVERANWRRRWRVSLDGAEMTERGRGV